MQTAHGENMQTPRIEKKPSSLRYYQEGVPTVDLESWRLRITGLVPSEIQLTYQDLLDLEEIYQHRRTVCVCNWSIKRHWEGVLLKDVLTRAGADIEDESLFVKQLSVGTEKGVYDSTIHLASAVKRDALLAYNVDGDKLPPEQGFPLRLIDFGLYGYKGVKGIGELHLTREKRIGYWEEFAGYDVDGVVKSKKYYSVDLKKHFFLEHEGEVHDEDLE